MKCVKILFFMVVLMIGLKYPVFAEMDHSMREPSKMSEEMKHDFDMKQSKGVHMTTLHIDGYKAEFHVMNMKAYHKMMKSMRMQHASMDPGSTHHIMIDLTDETGKKVTNAVFKIKIIDRSNHAWEKVVQPMVGHYGVDFKMVMDGTYQIIVKLSIGDKSYERDFYYERK